MTEPVKTRYFTSERPVFQGGVHYAPGKVIPVPADKCNGRKLTKDSEGKNVIVQLNVPSQHMTECNPKGGPLGTNIVPPPVPVESVARPVTMGEAGKHEPPKAKR